MKFLVHIYLIFSLTLLGVSCKWPLLSSRHLSLVFDYPSDQDGDIQILSNRPDKSNLDKIKSEILFNLKPDEAKEMLRWLEEIRYLKKKNKERKNHRLVQKRNYFIRSF